MTIKRTLARYLYVYGWRFRYLWFDTPLGPRCRLTAAALVAAFGVWQFVGGMREVADGQPVQAIWVQIAMLVVSMLISYALTPKTPDAVDQPGQAPKVEDGAGVRMVFGEVWITDPAVIGWKKIGTQTIRGKKSGFNGRPIIGYWYKQLFHFVLCRGPVDAVLEFRGGDKVAWAGELPASGDVQINKKDLWGGTGTGGEGGIEGPMEFLFGDAAQTPNGYLASALGSQQPAYRGLLTALFKGGLWGAFSPYPKAASFKVRRILQGWEREGGAWYPGLAAVPLSSSTFEHPTSLYIALDTSGSMAGTRLQVLKDGMSLVFDALAGRIAGSAPQINLHLVEWSSGSSYQESVPLTLGDISSLRTFVAGLVASGGTVATAAYGGVQQFMESSGLGNKVVVCVSDGAMSKVPQAMGMITAATDSVGYIAMRGIGIGTVGSLESFDNSGGVVPVIAGDNVEEMAATILAALSSTSTSGGMNPAHMLYQSITDSWMGAEPEAQISDASFRAAAVVLHAEAFGLCTEWVSSDESVEAFQQRICDVIGANLSRSPIDGKWYLDLIRGGYGTSSLPVLTDDDILDYTEQPGTLVDTVNQVIVEWRDPQQREDRSTAPVQSLGSIQAAGAVIGEVATYREIPDESLALRVAGRNLQSKCRPLRRISGKVTRVAHAWRPGQVINLQSAKRGIASMYCRVGDIDRGTLRSGAISLTLLQDVFGLPQTVYVEPEPGADTGEDDVPSPVEAAAVQEVTYALLAGLLPPGELTALTPDAGYLFAVATPAGAEFDYSLLVDSGTGYEQQDESDWSATATNAVACDRIQTSISIVGARAFDDAAIGAMVLWGSEICRLDGVDLIAGTVTLGRGCADTVPSTHAVGERMWVADDSVAFDATRYSAGATVAAKMLPRTASQRLAEAAAAALPLEFRGRAARPYPPALLRINGDPVPAAVIGEFVVTWAHRDRISQADQLIDTTAPSIGPEPTGRYGMRLLDAAQAVLIERGDIAGGTATVDLAYTGPITLELWSTNDAGDSLQRQVRTFEYTVDTASENVIAAPIYEPPYTIIDGGEVT